MVRVTSYLEARDAYRSRDLRQALYDEGDALMRDVIVNLHGAAHRDRRRLENRLFRRDTFAYYEAEVIPRTVEDALRPALEEGSADLISLSRHVMMSLAAEIAGVDRPEGTPEEFEALYDIMGRLSRASILVHATGDKQAIAADGDLALDEFERRFLVPSLERRRRLIDDVAAGRRDEAELPRDVLTTLLRNQENLSLPYEVIRREVAYFPWVGSHSTSNALAHAMNHILEWIDVHPGSAEALVDDVALLQRFVHESMRLHPPSPEAMRVALTDVSLPQGTSISEGDLVIIDVVAANRDTTVFGPDAEEFNPYRSVSGDAALWGLAFGSGFHACLGQELAGGLAQDDSHTPDDHLYGAVVTMSRALLRNGARRDPANPPQPDAGSRRPNFGRYPITFRPAPVATR